MSEITINTAEYYEKAASEIKFDNNLLFYLIGSNNCKLKMAEDATRYLKDLPAEVTLPSQTLFFHTVNLDIKDAIFACKALSVIYCIKVPIGYNKGYQWHICAATNKLTAEYQERLKTEGIEISSDYSNNLAPKEQAKPVKEQKSYEQGLYDGAREVYDLVITAFNRKYKLRAKLKDAICGSVEPLIEKFSKKLKR